MLEKTKEKQGTSDLELYAFRKKIIIMNRPLLG